jgi:hypothetical protein
LLRLDKSFQIFGGKGGKGNPSFPRKRDDKSLHPGKNGSKSASAYISPMEGLKVGLKRKKRGKNLFPNLS